MLRKVLQTELEALRLLAVGCFLREGTCTSITKVLPVLAGVQFILLSMSCILFAHRKAIFTSTHSPRIEKFKGLFQ